MERVPCKIIRVVAFLGFLENGIISFTSLFIELVEGLEVVQNWLPEPSGNCTFDSISWLENKKCNAAHYILVLRLLEKVKLLPPSTALML